MVRHYQKKSERGKYTIETMVEAVNKVREGRSMRSVATEFGLCDRTLANYCRRLTSGNAIPRLTSGASKHVPPEQLCVVSCSAVTHGTSSEIPDITSAGSSETINEGLSSTTVSVPGPSSAPAPVPGPSSAPASVPEPSESATTLLPELPSAPWSQFGFARKWLVSRAYMKIIKSI